MLDSQNDFKTETWVWLQTASHGYLLIWSTLHSRRIRSICHCSLVRFGRVRRRISICSTAVSLRPLLTFATSFSLSLAISFRSTSKRNTFELDVVRRDKFKPRQMTCELIYPFYLFYHEVLFATRVFEIVDSFSNYILADHLLARGNPFKKFCSHL